MIRINLLAEAKPVRKKRGVSALGGAGRLNTILIGVAMGVACLALLIHWWILSSAIKAQEEKIRVAQVEVTRLESVLKEVKDFETKKAKLQKKVDLINQLKQNQKGPVRLMDEVSKALPDLVWLERLDYRGNSISITGKAFNPPAVANFLENLKRVPAFQEPKVSFSACGGPGGLQLYCFELSFLFSTLDRTQPETGAPPPATAAPATGAARM
ncbi:MAG TPA: PilN domain-containing protein [Thermoanaerobaculia bacterium]|nr:PilN domain-containing protein [Thermoanaerobaculia bacterium]HQR68204.1 PilN domain-containing protein [Thermoanaerobaculia bacterium]